MEEVKKYYSTFKKDKLIYGKVYINYAGRAMMKKRMSGMIYKINRRDKNIQRTQEDR